MYEYCIIGGGPTGLTTALLLAERGHRVCVIDSNSSLGGCHRVIRENYAFSEHGPRVYSESFECFKRILDKISMHSKDPESDAGFYSNFTPYQFQLSNVLSNGKNGVLSVFSAWEIMLLIGAYIFSQNSHQSVYEWMTQHDFLPAAKDYTDRLCRLTDGADSTNYSMHKFLQLINQGSLYGFYSRLLRMIADYFINGRELSLI